MLGCNVDRLKWPRQTVLTLINMRVGAGYGWLEVKCRRCETRPSIPLDALRRLDNTPIWKLEAALKCRPPAGRRGIHRPSI